MTPQELAAVSAEDLERRFRALDGMLPFAILHTGEAPADAVEEYEALRGELERRRARPAPGPLRPAS